ncbi:MAG: 2-C-methyl-D-erythritol 2,4-cyclodiphosphate synthase [Trueperaceae bacterium]|nr:2-C-methyl-D-erythritol 2,4-cyclodiphosphate synthase [Trueperaceae bacterium]MCC6309706.1 2-C-methyl-D-erythritol 2,4-cyclodiphosphate synthase [Trueperaceae bacterium]MCO5173842.1 2-C-methyl-D-erythritol 2,4-cyclodiphosphate synthase [Trueperaceae bacterium]MCW5818956.1 2-C-methyl-D-erythritol 2,4-cyclodiphosphate synthase [Trueperaceae bacterium]
MSPAFRVGHGQDAHRLAPGRPLVIGGITVPSERGADAHSDGDVLLHALADALLSTHALGDIGKLFPPTDPAFAGLDSRTIVKRALTDLEERAGAAHVTNVAAVVTLDAPKLGRYRDEIAASVAKLLGIGPDAVGITFKTSEGLAPDHVQASVVLGVVIA